MTDEAKPVGGLAFFLSLIFLTLLATQNLRALLSEITSEGLLLVAAFLGTSFLGAFITWLALPQTICVFVHEFKHALLSGLAGNKVKGLVVRKSSGHFEYAYTRDTAAYNGFISLAPYITPLVSFPTVAALLIVPPSWHFLAVALAGLAYGADFYLNTRDISPVQTDITGIRGGYAIGRLYILICNAAFLTFLLAWVIGGQSGLVHLVEHLWGVATTIAGINDRRQPG